MKLVKRPLVLFVSIYLTASLTFTKFVKSGKPAGIFVSAVIFICLLALSLVFSARKKRALFRQFFTLSLIPLSIALALLSSLRLIDLGYEKAARNLSGVRMASVLVLESHKLSSCHEYTVLLLSGDGKETGEIIKCSVSEFTKSGLSMGDTARIKADFIPSEYESVINSGLSKRIFLTASIEGDGSFIEKTGTEPFSHFIGKVCEKISLSFCHL